MTRGLGRDAAFLVSSKQLLGGEATADVLGRIPMVPPVSVYLLAGAALLADAQIHTERVFGPELPGRYKHPASITELDNGDLYLVYYGGSGEYADDSGVYGARLAKGESEWSKPKRLTPWPKFPEGNSVVWQGPDRLGWLFSVIHPGAAW